MYYLLLTNDRHWITSKIKGTDKTVDKLIGIFDSYGNARARLIETGEAESERREYPYITREDGDVTHVVWKVTFV